MNLSPKKLLSGLTEDPVEQKNVIRLGANTVIQNADLPLYTGTELQAFQVKIGMSTSQMGLLSVPNIAINLTMTFIAAFFADRIKKRTLWAWVLISCGALFPLAMLVICLGPPVLRTPKVALLVFLGVGSITSFCNGIYGVLWATIFSRALRNEIRGRFIGIMGVVGSMIGMGMGLLSAITLKYFGFPGGFAVSFGLSTVMILVAAWVIHGTEELPSLAPPVAKKDVSPFVHLKNVVKMREFRLLMPANLLRGLGDGAGIYAIAVGMKQIGFGIEYAGYSTFLTYLGGFLATAMIGFFADRFGAGRLLPIIEVFLCMGLMGMVFAHTTWFFLACFLIWQMSLTMEGNAVPLVHFAVVPVEVIGAFTSVRLLLLTMLAGGSNFLVGVSLDRWPAVVIFAICALLKFSAGLLYWYGSANVKKDSVLCKAKSVA